MKTRTLVKEFASRSSSSIYKVMRDEDGNLSCDCRGWIYSGVKRECRHTREVVGEGLTPTPPTPGPKPSKKKLDTQATKALTGLAVPGLSLPYYAPMLAKESTPEQIEERFASEDWVAEPKYDGSRYLCYITKEGNRFFSRRISVKNGLPVEKTDNVPHLLGQDKLVNLVRGYPTGALSAKDFAGWEGTILDGEILPATGVFTDTTKIMGSLPDVAIEKQNNLGWMHYHVFDILYYKGENVMEKSLKERKSLLETIPQGEFLHVVQSVCGESNKRELLETIYSHGGEGIILKNINATYQPGERSKDIWMKIKSSRDYDVVVVGYDDPKQFSVNVQGETVENKHFTRKQIAAIKFGVYKDGKLIEVGQCSGLDDATREEVSRNKQNHIGEVMVVKGYGMLKDAIRHPQFIRFRDDKNPVDCKYEDLL